MFKTVSVLCLYTPRCIYTYQLTTPADIFIANKTAIDFPEYQINKQLNKSAFLITAITNHLEHVLFFFFLD